MAVKQFKCELSWSASRGKEWERCRKENWYARYGSWGWWTERPRGEKWEIMLHKSLTWLPAFAGNCVHDAVERWFQLKRSGTQMSATELYEEAVALFRDGWRQSAGEGWKERPNKSVHLSEHHYGEEISKERTGQVRELLERCARNFVESPELAPARDAHPDHWRALETLDTYQFLGTKVYAVPDFAYMDGETLHIWDWKTGRQREEDLFQLHTYALYGIEKWQQDPEAIVLHAAYLGEGVVKTVPVDIYALSEAQDRMSASVREMMDAHYDPDVDPVVEGNWPASPEPRKCGGCRFRGICAEAAR